MQETRAALLRAGMTLFAKQGLDAPSLDAICDKAGFTRGAFYVHFKDRDDFIVAVMESATVSFLDGVLAAQGGGAFDVASAVRAFALAIEGGDYPVFGDVKPHQFLAACARSSKLRRRYVDLMKQARDRLAEAIRAGQGEKSVRRDVDAEALAGLLVAMALGVGTMIELGVPFEAGPHAEALLSMVRAG